jgi:glyoxylase-like metal-dependent hydrolase (beta-lactamase superfamily II)
VQEQPDPGPDGVWTDPGAYRVAENVHRIPLPLPSDGLKAVNVYVLTTPEGLVMVDSGWAIDAAREALVAALDAMGASLGDIRRCLITHVHRDHYTLGVKLRSEFDLTVALGAGERPSLEFLHDEERRPRGRQVAELRSHGAKELAEEISKVVFETPDLSVWAFPDDWLTEGRLDLAGRSLEVVETPGHTAGHVVFHDEAAELLFAGDHVLPTITPSIGLQPARTDNPLGDFLGALAKVRARPDARLLPAHGAVTQSAHKRVDELIAFHGDRLDAMEKSIQAGATSVFEVASSQLWTRRGTRLEDLDIFNRMMAIGETGSHLDLLVAQGRLTREEIDEVFRYLPA